MNRKKIFKGAIIGGAIVFLWCLISWMVLPWHAMAFKKFDDEASVAHAIRNNTRESGVYVLPNTFKYNRSTPSGEIEEGVGLMKGGPTMFASVQVNGMGNKTVRPFVVSLILEIIGAGIVAWMLLQTKGLKYKHRVCFVTLFGLVIGVLGVLPGWNWWCFSACYTLTLFFDLIIGWFLAGLALAKICKP